MASQGRLKAVCQGLAGKVALAAAYLALLLLCLRLGGLTGGAPPDDGPPEVAAATARRLGRNGSAAESQNTSGNLAMDKAQAHYYELCQPLIDRAEEEHVDTFTWEEADKCWQACREVVPIYLLNSWIGRWQSGLQDRLPAAPARWVATGYRAALGHLPSWAAALLPSGPLLLAGYPVALALTSIMMVGLAMCLPKFSEIAFLVFLGLGSGLIVVVHAWLTLVAGLCLWAASIAVDPMAINEAVPWAWMDAASSFRLPHLPLVVSLPILFIGTVKIALRLLAWLDCHSPEDSKTLFVTLGWCSVFLVAALVVCSIEVVGLLAYAMLQSGIHGPEWVCGKSFAGSLFGWLPNTFCYTVGAIYAGLGVVHGLCQRTNSVHLAEDARPKADNGRLWSDATSAAFWLRLKFVGLFADTSFDFSQIVLFLQRSQLYFAIYNACGLLIQMGLFVAQLVRGKLPDVPLLSVILQSDTIVLMRESKAAGFVLHELYDKLHREAFGETYVSLTVAIIAVFTVSMQSIFDVVFFVFSIMLSLSSVKSGMAKALEIVEAEDEQEVVPGFRVRMILPNHYYYRRSFAEQRKLSHVAKVRVIEALVPAVTAAVCCRCSSVKATYLTCCTTASTLLLVQMITNHGMEFMRSLVGGMPLCIALLRLPLLLVGLLFSSPLFFISPLVYASPYAYPIAVSQSSRSGIAAEVFNISDMLYTKVWFAGVLWFLLGVSIVKPQWSPFAFGLYLRQTYDIVLRGWSAASVLGVVQLVLMAMTIPCIVVMSVATRSIQSQIKAWKQQDEKAAKALQADCEMISNAAVSAISQMRNLSILGPESFPECGAVGTRSPLERTPVLSLLTQRLLNAAYGPADRADRILDKKHHKFDAVEFRMRELCKNWSGGNDRYLSPSALAEDLESARNQALSWYWESEHSPPKDQVRAVVFALDAVVKWLNGLCMFDLIYDPAEKKDHNYQLMGTHDSAASAEQGLSKAASLADDLQKAVKGKTSRWRVWSRN